MEKEKYNNLTLFFLIFNKFNDFLIIVNDKIDKIRINKSGYLIKG